MRTLKRTPRNYDGGQLTGRKLTDLLPQVMAKITGKAAQSSTEVLDAWPKIVGAKIGKMARAVSFDSGILKVKVDNSTLYSLLTLHEKEQLLEKLRKHFPKITLKNIVFRIG